MARVVEVRTYIPNSYAKYASYNENVHIDPRARMMALSMVRWLRTYGNSKKIEEWKRAVKPGMLRGMFWDSYGYVTSGAMNMVEFLIWHPIVSYFFLEFSRFFIRMWCSEVGAFIWKNKGRVLEILTSPAGWLDLMAFLAENNVFHAAATAVVHAVFNDARNPFHKTMAWFLLGTSQVVGDAASIYLDVKGVLGASSVMWRVFWGFMNILKWVVSGTVTRLMNTLTDVIFKRELKLKNPEVIGNAVSSGRTVLIEMILSMVLAAVTGQCSAYRSTDEVHRTFQQIQKSVEALSRPADKLFAMEGYMKRL